MSAHYHGYMDFLQEEDIRLLKALDSTDNKLIREHIIDQIQKGRFKLVCRDMGELKEVE